MNNFANTPLTRAAERAVPNKTLTAQRRQGVRDAAQQAVEKSWLRSDELLAAWGHYARACTQNSIISLADVLCEEYRNGKTFLEEALDSGDPRTLRFLQTYLESGVYAGGLIVRDARSIYKVIDKEAKIGFGYLAEPEDTLYTGYTGQIVHGERHGWGRFDYGLYDYYEGNWAHGKRHGFGKIHRETPDKAVVREGVFCQGVQVRQLRKTCSPSKLDFFKRIKTMVFPS